MTNINEKKKKTEKRVCDCAKKSLATKNCENVPPAVLHMFGPNPEYRVLAPLWKHPSSASAGDCVCADGVELLIPNRIYYST